MPLIIQKFGGTSVADINCIANVAEIIKNTINQGNVVIAVVSAMAGSTKDLISKCSDVSNLTTNTQLREYDAAVSSGEIITAALLALQLDKIGVTAKSLQGWQIPIHTNRQLGNAMVEKIDTSKLKDYIALGITPIITGFQGVTNDLDVTTLGIGGSDTTAALITAALGADRCDIYTDVEGVFTADPRIEKNARKIHTITTMEMLKISSLGAKILHPRAAVAIVKYGINMQILSSFNKKAGTIINDDDDNNNNNDTTISINNTTNNNNNNDVKNSTKMEEAKIKTITSNSDILKIDIDCKQEMVNSLLQKISDNNLTYMNCKVNGDSMSIIAKLSDLGKFEELLTNIKEQQQKEQQLVTKFKFSSNMSTVSLVGYGINSNNRLITRVLQILGEHNIVIYSMNCHELDITFFIKDIDVDLAIRSLHTLIID